MTYSVGISFYNTTVQNVEMGQLSIADSIQNILVNGSSLYAWLS